MSWESSATYSRLVNELVGEGDARVDPLDTTRIHAERVVELALAG